MRSDWLTDIPRPRFFCKLIRFSPPLPPFLTQFTYGSHPRKPLSVEIVLRRRAGNPCTFGLLEPLRPVASPHEEGGDEGGGGGRGGQPLLSSPQTDGPRSRLPKGCHIVGDGHRTSNNNNSSSSNSNNEAKVILAWHQYLRHHASHNATKVTSITVYDKYWHNPN